MTTAIDRRWDDLAGRADEAERRLLLTLDVLADRRRHLRVVLTRARERIEAGVLVVSMFVLVGVAMFGFLSLTRRPRPARILRRR